MEDRFTLSRRRFLRSLSSAPLLLRPAPLLCEGLFRSASYSSPGEAHRYTETRFQAHYPAASDLADVLRHVPPGSDEYITEGYAFEIAAKFRAWTDFLRNTALRSSPLSGMLAPDLIASSFRPVSVKTLRSGFGLDVTAHAGSPAAVCKRELFLASVQEWLQPLRHMVTAEIEIFAIEVLAQDPLTVRLSTRYDFVGVRKDERREERVGTWTMTWIKAPGEDWKIHRWEAGTETSSIGAPQGFHDVTLHALGSAASFQEQMSLGVDHWRTVLDGACGTDIYANNGVAAGDFNNDGFDDLYVCQPAGLPNRLYRNRGNGTFEDVTDHAGVGVLDNTACALFADFDNRGLQDLLVVCGSGPLLFRNQGDGRFLVQREAFHFAQPPQGTFTHAAIADYDGDGRLDVFFCTYMYYLGLDQYHYPAPYYNARNGPPNVLMHNEGNGRFTETTQAAGLNAENNRYSFACAWGDANGDGHPDLVIANDFGTSQLYRNRGDGTFTVASSTSHIEDVGAGMSACWCDFNNDGHQDIYITSMWEAAGQRVATQPHFHSEASPHTRSLYQRHARGNALYRNNGDGTFLNAGEQTNTAMGRWSWSADFWDIDHDGYPDLYVTNGYLSAEDRSDLAGFFWRQVVANSPDDATPLRGYERGWNAINELVRSDSSWNAYERNVLFANNRDGTFSEVAGVVGLDCLEDSRAFALADLDHDGRLEVILKNRNAPQLRVLRNAMPALGQSIAFRLRGTRSNRDAIGARLTLECGTLRQTRYVQAGTGFLSQHSKEILFGVGNTKRPIKATVRWPSGLVQTFPSLTSGKRFEIVEGVEAVKSEPFADPPPAWLQAKAPEAQTQALPQRVETWLIAPLKAPVFTLPDLAGKMVTLEQFLGGPILLHLWSYAEPEALPQLHQLQGDSGSQSGRKLQVLAINIDEATEAERVRSAVKQQGLSVPVLLGTAEMAGIYNIIFRYLFDRRRDLALPTSFLLDSEGMIVKVYQGAITLGDVRRDVAKMPSTAADRTKLALPFHGELFQGAFQRNDFTYGVALFQHGYLDQAKQSFQQVVATRPDDPEAFYNLGTLHLRQNELTEARGSLRKALALRPEYPEAWNNLGMIDAEEGHAPEAIENFEKALQQRPQYETALLNLGNVYRRQHEYGKAADLLNRALALQPDDPEISYSLGMLKAQQEDLPAAELYLRKAIDLKPVYPEALNNLGIVYVHLREFDQAKQQFETGVQVAPDNDQAYLNLARLYALQHNQAAARGILQLLLQRQPQNAAANHALQVLQ